jgi:hypothetical protein
MPDGAMAGNLNVFGAKNIFMFFSFYKSNKTRKKIFC